MALIPGSSWRILQLMAYGFHIHTVVPEGSVSSEKLHVDQFHEQGEDQYANSVGRWILLSNLRSPLLPRARYIRTGMFRQLDVATPPIHLATAAVRIRHLI